MLRLTRQQVREIDRRTIQDYHMPGIVLMEAAAACTASFAIGMLGDRRGPVQVVCGGGNNGGDGLGIARRLHSAGISTTILLATDPQHYRGDAQIEWQMSQAWRVPFMPATPQLIRDANSRLIIDAIFGTGLNRAPERETADLIRAINQRSVPVLAVDIPSGLDCDSGQPFDPCIRATCTVTFVAEKIGFANRSAAEFLGKVHVVDIGSPRELIERIAAST